MAQETDTDQIQIQPVSRHWSTLFICQHKDSEKFVGEPKASNTYGEDIDKSYKVGKN